MLINFLSNCYKNQGNINNIDTLWANPKTSVDTVELQSPVPEPGPTDA